MLRCWNWPSWDFFLRHLQAPAEQADVLRQAGVPAGAEQFLLRLRLGGERPLGAEAFDDPFRRGVLTLARVASEAELGWPATTLKDLETR